MSDKTLKMDYKFIGNLDSIISKGKVA